jgi:hypothetical protein
MQLQTLLSDLGYYIVTRQNFTKKILLFEITDKHLISKFLAGKSQNPERLSGYRCLKPTLKMESLNEAYSTLKQRMQDWQELPIRSKRLRARANQHQTGQNETRTTNVTQRRLVSLISVHPLFSYTSTIWQL